MVPGSVFRTGKDIADLLGLGVTESKFRFKPGCAALYYSRKPASSRLVCTVFQKKAPLKFTPESLGAVSAESISSIALSSFSLISFPYCSLKTLAGRLVSQPSKYLPTLYKHLTGLYFHDSVSQTLCWTRNSIFRWVAFIAPDRILFDFFFDTSALF